MKWLDGPIRPEAERRAWANKYADLQKLKLKVVVALFVLAWAAHGFPLP